jgi:hypothetical protein
MVLMQGAATSIYERSSPSTWFSALPPQEIMRLSSPQPYL